VEARRVEHSRKRRRMLYGAHDVDLDRLLRQAVGNVRAEAWRPIDLSANPYLSIWSQLAVLYAEAPLVVTEPGAEGVAEALAAAGYWQAMMRVQRDALAMREMLVRIDATEDGRVVARPVYPDMVEARCDPADPSRLVSVLEWVQRDGQWLAHECSIDGEVPRYTVTTRSGDAVTRQVLGQDYAGDAYPYRLEDGAPIVPYVLYHAAETGCLFDPYTMREVVEGSLMLGVYLTYFGHVLRSASWPQRYAIGAQVLGADAVDADGNVQAGRREVVTDPATLVEMVVDPAYTGQPLVGQWQTSADPEKVLTAVAMYERRVLTLAGVQAPDVTRQDADIRSGYSLAVSRESAREAQRVYEPQFRRGDCAALAMAAALLNRATGSAYPESPAAYRVTYRGLPRSPAELMAQVSEIKARVDAGLLGPVSAYIEIHPGTPREEAVDAVARARMEGAEVSAAMSRIGAAMRLPVVAPPPPPADEGDIP
jgi:hypothetical protein